MAESFQRVLTPKDIDLLFQAAVSVESAAASVKHTAKQRHRIGLVRSGHYLKIQLDPFAEEALGVSRLRLA